MTHISQDSFNKLVTTVLLLFVLVMYVIAYITGRPLDLSSLWALLAPVLTHTIHLLSNKISDKNGSNGGKP